MSHSRIRPILASLALVVVLLIAGAPRASAATPITLFGQEVKANQMVSFCLTDSFGFDYTLTYAGEFIGGAAILRGTVDTGANGVWYVTDMHTLAGDTFVLTAENPSPSDPGEAAVFTYKGTYDRNTNSGTATWANMFDQGSSAGASGTVASITGIACAARSGATVVDGPTPASRTTAADAAPTGTITLFGQTIDATQMVTFCLSDDFAYAYELTYAGEFVSGSAILRGTVDTGAGGVWYVTDIHTLAGDTFAMTAENGTPENGFAAAFTYKGTYNRATNSGSAVWANMLAQGSASGASGNVFSIVGVACAAQPAAVPVTGPAPAQR